MSEAELLRVIDDVRPGTDEVANGATHGFGLLLSVIGSAALLSAAWVSGDAWRFAGCAVYAIALIGVYAFSTLSHVVVNPRPRQLFRILDQAFIYLLIVGTFTPLSLAFLRTGVGWSFLALMWSIALAGFISKIVFAHRVDGVSLWIYIAMGWMLGLASWTLGDYISATGVAWMVIGGVCYTAGTAFLMNDHRRWYYHAIWHLFVIAGSVSHFYVIFYFVALTG